MCANCATPPTGFVLGLGLRAGGEAGRPTDTRERLADSVADFERGVIAGALAAHGGSLKPVYEALGISRKTLYEKMQKYGLDKHDSATDGDASRSESQLDDGWNSTHP